MKKPLLILIVIAILVLFGYVLINREDLTKTTGGADVSIQELISDDDSLETIEMELNDTELEDFEAEFEALDEEINNL